MREGARRSGGIDNRRPVRAGWGVWVVQQVRQQVRQQVEEAAPFEEHEVRELQEARELQEPRKKAR